MKRLLHVDADQQDHDGNGDRDNEPGVQDELRQRQGQRADDQERAEAKQEVRVLRELFQLFQG